MCWGARRSAGASRGWWRRPARARAGCSCCAASRGSARRRCSSTRPRRRAPPPCCARAASSPRSRSPSAGCTSCCAPCSASSGAARPAARALEAALGLAPAAAAEPHLVGAATLGLLAALAEQRPVVVLADDVHWLDGPSASALVFAARRLLADAVAVVLAVRAGEPSPIDGAGLEKLALAGLGAEPARALLEAHAARPVAADTAGWLHAATGGNPLALVEVAAEAPRLRPARSAVTCRSARGIERAFGRRLERLPPRRCRAAGGGGRRRRRARARARRGARAGRLAGRPRGGGGGRARQPRARAGRVPPPAHALGRARPRGARRPPRRAPRLRGGASIRASERAAWHAAAGTLEADEGVAASLAAAAVARAGAAGTPRRPPRSSRPRGSAPIRRGARSGCAARPTPRGSRATGRARSRCSTKRRRLRSTATERAEAGHLRGRVLARRGPVPLAVRSCRRRPRRSPRSSRPRRRRCSPRRRTRRSTGPARPRTWSGSPGARSSSRRRTSPARGGSRRSRWVRRSCWAGARRPRTGWRRRPH